LLVRGNGPAQLFGLLQTATTATLDREFLQGALGL